MLTRVNANSIRHDRRSNYIYLAERLRNAQCFRPLFPSLPDGVCPLHFPIVPNKNIPELHAVIARRCGLYPWWSQFHSALALDHYPESTWLKRNCFVLPIHSGVDKRHLGYLADSVLAADREVQ